MVIITLFAAFCVSLVMASVTLEDIRGAETLVGRELIRNGDFPINSAAGWVGTMVLRFGYFFGGKHVAGFDIASSYQDVNVTVAAACIDDNCFDCHMWVELGASWDSDEAMVIVTAMNESKHPKQVLQKSDLTGQKRVWQ